MRGLLALLALLTPLALPVAAQTLRPEARPVADAPARPALRPVTLVQMPVAPVSLLARAPEAPVLPLLTATGDRVALPSLTLAGGLPLLLQRSTDEPQAGIATIAEVVSAHRRPQAREVVAVSAPGRPQARPAALEAGQGDAAALGAPFRPALRPIWVVAEHGGTLTAPAAPRLLADVATTGAPLTEVALSTRGAMLPLPRLARSERLLGEFAQHVALVVPLAPPLRPAIRPAAITPVLLVQPLGVAPRRPALRPDGLAAEELALLEQAAFVAAIPPPLPEISALAVPRALRPELRPRVVSMRELAPPPDAPPEPARSTGPGLCGDSRLQGEAVGNVPGAGSCGIEDAVRVTSVGGVRLSDSATINCTTARALADWVENTARPAVGGTGGGLVGLQIMGSYACRGRNNVAGARLSEHAFGRAIDIGGFVLADGTRFTVLNNWGGSTYGRILRTMHDDACGTFGTVLGPEANSYHRDHFHFDTASGRSPYCR